MEGIVLLSLEVPFIDEQAWLVARRPAIMYAERCADAALVTEVINVQDLSVLIDHEFFLAHHLEAAVLTTQHRELCLKRGDVVCVVRPVRADIDALIAHGGALQAPPCLCAGLLFGERFLHQIEPRT